MLKQFNQEIFQRIDGWKIQIFTYPFFKNTMPTVESIYLGDLRTQAKHLQSGTTILTDAPIDNQGKGEAFSPTDLVAAALGSCMMTIMGIYARRVGMDLTGTRYQITKIMANDPRRIAEILVNFDFPDSLDIDETEQQKLRRAALTCPVALSISTEIKQNITFNFKKTVPV